MVKLISCKHSYCLLFSSSLRLTLFPFFLQCAVLASFVSIWHQLGSYIVEEETTTEKMIPWKRASGKSVVHFLDWWSIWKGLAHVGSDTSGLVLLAAIRIQTDQAIRSKSVSGNPLWPPLQFLPPGSCPQVFALASFDGWLLLENIKRNKSFPPQVVFGCGVLSQHEKH